jgi:DNA invertase Pin-like site-specific DNA recombinase
MAATTTRMAAVLGGLAEFERELIRARTHEGRVRAVACGVKLGRTPNVSHILSSDPNVP